MFRNHQEVGIRITKEMLASGTLPVLVSITREDIDSGECGSSSRCAIAIAIKRTLELTELGLSVSVVPAHLTIYPFLENAFIERKATWLYDSPIQKFIAAFDYCNNGLSEETPEERKAAIEPTSFWFEILNASQAMTAAVWKEAIAIQEEAVSEELADVKAELAFLQEVIKEFETQSERKDSTDHIYLCPLEIKVSLRAEASELFGPILKNSMSADELKLANRYGSFLSHLWYPIASQSADFNFLTKGEEVNKVRFLWLSFAEDCLISEITELESLAAALEALDSH